MSLRFSQFGNIPIWVTFVFLLFVLFLNTVEEATHEEKGHSGCYVYLVTVYVPHIPTTGSAVQNVALEGAGCKAIGF